MNDSKKCAKYLNNTSCMLDDLSGPLVGLEQYASGYA